MCVKMIINKFDSIFIICLLYFQGFKMSIKKDDRINLRIKIEKELHKPFKILVAEKYSNMNQCINDLIRENFKKNRKL